MKRLSFMLIAGEASGDTLAAELVQALDEESAFMQAQPTDASQPLYASLQPRFFGMGGPEMAAAGVELIADMAAYSVFGVADVVKDYLRFRRLMSQLVRAAIERQPDVIVCVDFSGFNRRFAHRVKSHVRSRRGTFADWNPKVVQFVSPQVWASRPGRAQQMARDIDLVLSIFPFEKAWYSERVPELKVEFVGHPLLDRYGDSVREADKAESRGQSPRRRSLLLLPGSRRKELERHLLAMTEAVKQIVASGQAVTTRLVLPTAALAEQARPFIVSVPEIELQIGGLDSALAEADLAIASSGTVTLECAFFGVPTVVLYKLSGVEFRIAKRIVQVSHIAMPNLLAGETVFPEFIQQAATPENLSQAVLEWLNDENKRAGVKAKLRKIVASLGDPGATGRAAKAVMELIGRSDVASRCNH